MGSKKRNPLFKSHSPSYDGKGKHTRGGDFETARERRGAYGIGAAGSGFAGVRHRGLFRGGRVARFFAIGTSGRSAGGGARSKEREDMPWLSRQWPTPPEQEKPREKGGKSSRLAG